MAGAFSVINTFIFEKPVIRREYESGLISPTAYITAKMLADIPVQIVFPIIFSVWDSAEKKTYNHLDLGSSLVLAAHLHVQRGWSLLVNTTDSQNRALMCFLESLLLFMYSLQFRIAYYLMGLNDEFVRFLISVVIILIVSNAAMSIGYFASAVGANVSCQPRKSI